MLIFTFLIPLQKLAGKSLHYLDRRVKKKIPGKLIHFQNSFAYKNTLKPARETKYDFNY